jgi:peroxiredoxin
LSFRSILHVLFAALLLLSVVSSIATQAGHADVPIADTADAIQPLGKGERAPRFIVRTVDGEPFDFDPQKLDRPVVLLAFRGGWCPYCNLYLSEMRDVIPAIRAMGVDVLFLSGDRPAMLFESLNHETKEAIAGLNYTVLSDADVQAATALGIAFRASQQTINRRHEKGEDIEGSSMAKHGILPVPAVFAIDRHGLIQFVYTNADYKIRLPAEELLAAARAIAAAD